MIEDIAGKLKRYAELKIRAKGIDDELEEIKPFIKEHMMGEGIDKLPTSAGVFSVSEKTTWKYSKEVEKLQKSEKANGTAQALKSVVLKFTPEGAHEEQ